MNWDIVHSTDRHFVVKAKKGFEVYRNEVTHAVRCAIIGYEGDRGLAVAIAELERRESNPENREKVEQ